MKLENPNLGFCTSFAFLKYITRRCLTNKFLFCFLYKIHKRHQIIGGVDETYDHVNFQSAAQALPFEAFCRPETLRTLLVAL